MTKAMGWLRWILIVWNGAYVAVGIVILFGASDGPWSDGPWSDRLWMGGGLVVFCGLQLIYLWFSRPHLYRT
jgi:hypothetical protein